MNGRVLIPLLFGIAGVVVLLGLGKWQLDRLAWKEGVLAGIEARIGAEPVPLPETPDRSEDKYLPVEVTGVIEPGALRVLVSQKRVGAGYRLVSALDTGDRRVLVDRGFIEVAEALPEPPEGSVTVTGNLHWPDDRLDSTPENDIADNTWFARDIGPMSEELGTEPLLVTAREVSPPEPGVTPLPVDTAAIPNDHLEYAITWFSLAAVWAIMTAVVIGRERRAAKGAVT